jgi:hypothetical protein
MCSTGIYFQGLARSGVTAPSQAHIETLSRTGSPALAAALMLVAPVTTRSFSLSRERYPMEKGADPSLDGQLPPDSVIPAALDQAAVQQSEDDGMPEHVQKAADPQGWEADRVERNRCPEASVPPRLSRVAVSEAPMTFREDEAHGKTESTDLQRRFSGGVICGVQNMPRLTRFEDQSHDR